MENLPKDYFLDIDDQLLNFLEKQGEDCIRELHQSNTVNKENSYKLLNILLVGIGSSFLLLTQKQPFFFLSVGMVTFILCWALCTIYLVFCGLSIQVRGLVSSSPHLLYTEAYKTINQDDFGYLEAKGFSGDRDCTSVMRRYRLNNLCKTSSELCCKCKNQLSSKKSKNSYCPCSYFFHASFSGYLSLFLTCIDKVDTLF